jgi:hypothetical protein
MEVGELGGGGKMDNYPAKKIYADIIDPNTSIDNSPYERAVKKEQLDQMPGPFDSFFFRALGLIEAAGGGIGNAVKGKNTLHGGSYKNNTANNKGQKTSSPPNNSRSNASVYNYLQQNPAPNPQNPLIPNKSQYSLNPNLGNTNKVTAPEPIPKVVPQSATKQKKAAEQKAAEKAAEKKVAAEKAAVQKIPIQVSEDLIIKSLRDSDMLSLQEKVSLPMVQRYVKMLEDGLISPPIKVAENIIVEGNHRYIAGKIYGKLPDVVPATLPLSMKDMVRPIKEIKIDFKDWGGY